MHVFFEDDGTFKAGTVLADNDTSLQVEAASGKRLKIKSASVLLRFAEPSPSALLADAQTLAAGLDPNFLWEVSDGREFAVTDLAAEYYGHTPRQRIFTRRARAATVPRRPRRSRRLWRERSVSAVRLRKSRPVRSSSRPIICPTPSARSCRCFSTSRTSSRSKRGQWPPPAPPCRPTRSLC